MPSLHRPRVLSLNFFNRGDNGSPSPANGNVTLKKTDSANSSSRDLPSKEPSSPVVRDTTLTATPPRTRAGTGESRPASQMFAYTPSLIGSGPAEQIEELLPVFGFLSSHGNKLYQEGYFLKLNDLDTNGKPNADRNWTECFAQLVGTVLSLWDAAALDAAGQDGEVPPTFINLADASIKMIQTLPTRNQDVQPLQNVLSISTAGKNRYLLHFNSLHSLTQWTAGIRLSMFEHASLQEVYTGSLIAGKGKHLNNIKSIMEKSRFRTEDWARVRFGAGTPWRRCWCVIEPPDEKEYAKANKASLKKRSAYERPSLPKGDIKFYDTKKTKKAVPIATITDAYSAYAIYPQSKPLIDQSTLVKVEGKITIHSKPESKTEGFVFVMPEVHPAVSGFEMMLRWLFPVYDTFNLYGRPTRLIADTLDPRGLMFAMPKDRRYGYLDIMDVAALIHTDGSDRWTEREWRKQMKEITSRRMTKTPADRDSNTFQRNHRQSLGSRTGIPYDENGAIRSQPGNQSTEAVFATPRKAGTAPPGGPFPISNLHNRSASENVTTRSPTKSRSRNEPYKPSRMSLEQDMYGHAPLVPAPAPPASSKPYRRANGYQNGLEQMDSCNSSDSELQPQHTNPEDLNKDVGELAPPTPVVAPPTIQHEAGDRPRTRPAERPDLRREKSRMSSATLAQMTEASKMNTTGTAAAGATAAWKTREGITSGDSTPRGVNQTPIANGTPANHLLDAGMIVGSPEALQPPKRNEPGSRTSSGHSIARKPLPSTNREHSATRIPSHGDEAPPLPTHQTTMLRPANTYADRSFPAGAVLSTGSSQDEMSESDDPFADNASTDSLDYMSTTKSADTREAEPSVAKSRTGVLKTVGHTERPEALSTSYSNIPEIDFGPTQSLSPNSSRPNTSSDIPSGRKSPLGSFPSEPHTLQAKRASPGAQRNLLHERPSTVSPSTSYNHDQRHSVAWKPGITLSSEHQSPGQRLTPQEFVQQRAATASVPSGYVPRRHQSSGSIDHLPSGNFTASKRDSFIRQQQMNTPPIAMQQDDAKLSAREQEHMAKMTGMPLVSVPPSRAPDPSIGLIGAIEAREQEKRSMHEGVSGQMGEAAIVQRQLQERQQLYRTQSQAHYAAQMAYGGYPGPQPQQYHAGNQGQRQQQYYVAAQQGQWPPGQFPQQIQGPPAQQPYQWPRPKPHYQQRFSGYYSPDSGQQDPYRR